MTDKQSEALRLLIEELRRLQTINAQLLEALEFCAGTSYITDANEVAHAAIASAKGEA